MYWGNIPNERVRGTKPCNRGPQCYFLKKGQCWFYHPPEHTKKKSYSKNSNNSLSLFEGLSFLRQNSSFQNLFQLMKEKEREKKERMQEIMRERLREQEKQRQRKRKIMAQRQRQLAAQRARFLAQRRATLQQQHRLMLQKIKQKKADPKFDWYFANNKSFRALETSEEKLKELDQCIICFCSFWDHKEEYDKEVGLSKKELLQKELTELYCKHIFHKECIHKWLKSNPKCPVCRKDFREHAEYKKFEEEKKLQEKKEMKKVKRIIPQLRRLTITPRNSFNYISFEDSDRDVDNEYNQLFNQSDYDYEETILW